eukprot:c36650_g1_i1 orf=21-284(-)
MHILAVNLLYESFFKAYMIQEDGLVKFLLVRCHVALTSTSAHRRSHCRYLARVVLCPGVPLAGVSHSHPLSLHMSSAASHPCGPPKQ